MLAPLTIEPKSLHSRASMRGVLAALGKAWTAYTLNRAIADVEITSDRDYRAFGLDKAEILTALVRLRGEVESGTAADTDHAQLAIVVTRRKPEARVRS